MMTNKRIIPVLLIQNKGAYKTTRFKNPVYLGDPINIIRIFNEKEVDELIILDISASKNGPNFSFTKELASECFSPMAYGGGLKGLTDVEQILNMGYEKVVISTLLHENPKEVIEIAKRFGSQALVACLEVRRGLLGSYQVYFQNGTKKVESSLTDTIKAIANLGVGELFINDIDREGTYKGYDMALHKKVAECSSMPIIACGGARSLQDFSDVLLSSKVSAAAASSTFIFQGPHRAVLLSYPTQEEIEKLTWAQS